MNFQDWKREIGRRAFACGDSVPSYKEEDAERIVAAAAVVIAEHGEEWVLENPQRFQASVINKVGTWMSLGFFVLRFLGFTNPLLALASFILPTIANWLQEHVSLASKGLCAATDWGSMKSEALLFVRNSNGQQP